LVGSVPCVRKVAGTITTEAAMYRDLGEVLHLLLPVALQRRVNSDTVSILQFGAPPSSSGLEEVLHKYPGMN